MEPGATSACSLSKTVLPSATAAAWWKESIELDSVWCQRPLAPVGRSLMRSNVTVLRAAPSVTALIDTAADECMKGASLLN